MTSRRTGLATIVRTLCRGVIIASLLASCGGSHARTTTFGSGSGAPTLAQITALLVRHSRAVLAQSSAGFLADVDTAAVSAAFRNRQTAEIAALASVPLRTWTYAISSPVTDASTVEAAAKRLGAATSIVHVSLDYALAGVDPQPASHDLWWTFVTRRGHVYLADDADMSALGGQSWRGMWDFGPIVAQRGVASLVLGRPSNAAQLMDVAAAVDAAVPVVDAVWGTGWSSMVAVLVPASATEFAALIGQVETATGASSLADVSAETVFESASQLSGARVILNPSALARLSRIGRRIVVQHEITHIATAASTTVASPRWLVEGFADYVANLGTGQPIVIAAAELRAEVGKRALPAVLPTDADFQSGSSRLAAVYEESWLACRLVAARAGQAALVRLYRLVGASPDASAAVSDAVRSVLHETIAVFIAQWRAYLVEQLA